MNHIEQVSGPCIILAGAGTGKTRSMVDKVKYIVEKEIYRPEEIVCVTFSNEAARSLHARIMGSIGDTDVVVKTFHSLCADLLKREGHRIGIKEDFKILLPDEAMVYLYKFFKINPNRCRDYVSAIGMAKDLGISLEDYENFLNEKKKGLPVNFERELEVLQFQLNTLVARKDKSLYKKTLQDKIDYIAAHMKRQRFFMAWKAYEKLKSKRGFQDYSDLNKNAFILLEKYPEVVKWKYCIVDEFQDTNKMQVDFLSLIAPHGNITIVGDLNQSIYRFRGAYKNNIDNFKERFNVKKENIYELDKSHRSPNVVLRTAHKLISKNYDNKDDCFFVENAHGIEGDIVEVYELKNAREEVRKIMEIIDSEIERGTKQEEICVMFRTHHQANLLKKALELKGLNFSSTNRKSLLKDDRVRQVVAYLETIYALKNNRSASAPLWDLVYHMSFSREDLEKIGEFLRKNGRDEKANEILKGVLELSENGKKQIVALDLRIQELLNCYDTKLIDMIEKIKMFFDFSELEETKKGVESVLAVKLFDEMVKDYSNFEAEDIASFIYHIEAIRSLNLEMDAPSVGSSGVKIMTAHSTKGLEYDVVIVANLVKGKFPIERVNNNPLIPPEISPELKDMLLGKSESDKEEIVRFYEFENQIKEERRLCYVAFTRTKKRLYVTYAKDYGNKKHDPSQFLEELGFRDNKDIKFEIDNFEKYSELTSVKNDISAYPEKEITFSPSALNTFADCQKRYEYKYVLGMPDTIPKNNESIILGSFVHSVIEFGVKENIKDERGFMYLAKEFSLKPEWEGVQADDALTLLRVFFQRNKDKYDAKSVSEENLYANLDGFRFRGIADRIDIHSDGVEIIDYKTGYANVPPRARNWQLGFYALAAGQKYGRVKRVTLDMLRHDKPLEFDVKANGLAVERNSGRMSFSLEAVRQELIEAAQSIKEAYKKGFVPCSVEKNCEFCNEWVWKI